MLSQSFKEETWRDDECCKHCLVTVITINYKSSLPFPQTDTVKGKLGSYFILSLQSVRHSQYQ